MAVVYHYHIRAAVCCWPLARFRNMGGALQLVLQLRRYAQHAPDRRTALPIAAVVLITQTTNIHRNHNLIALGIGNDHLKAIRHACTDR